MKHSIRRQFTRIFVTVLIVTVLLTVLCNFIFLKQYYVFNKAIDIHKAYYMLEKAVEEGRINEFTFHEEMLLFCEKTDISVLVIDNDLNVILSVRNDDDMVKRVMNDPSFSLWSKDDVENMKVTVFNDPDTDASFLGKRGYINEDLSFLIKCPVLAIQEYVDITNRFYIAVSAVGLFLGVLAIIFFTHRFIKPIVKLNEISSKVANLDFNTKYDYSAKNEIDELGKNINEMSDKLEKTISELKSANAELLRDIERKNRNEEMRKEFLANVSHELKTPIALIQSYSDGLREGIIDDEENKEYYLTVINEEAVRMNNIVKEIMSLSRLEYGYDPFEIERFDIVEMINNKIMSSEYLFKKNSVSVEFENKDESVFVWADEGRTESVFMNYLTNAMHYCGGDRIIKIYLEVKEDVVRINVFNTGDNIDDEEIKKIWDKFYKTDKARLRDEGGSGIGLSIVKAIMSSLKMAYGCENKENGVNFYFELSTK